MAELCSIEVSTEHHGLPDPGQLFDSSHSPEDRLKVQTAFDKSQVDASDILPLEEDEKERRASIQAPAQGLPTPGAEHKLLPGAIIAPTSDGKHEHKEAASGSKEDVKNGLLHTPESVLKAKDDSGEVKRERLGT